VEARECTASITSQFNGIVPLVPIESFQSLRLAVRCSVELLSVTAFDAFFRPRNNGLGID